MSSLVREDAHSADAVGGNAFPKLAACPFCGSDAGLYLRVERTPSRLREVPFYVCGHCAAEGAKPAGSWEIGQAKCRAAQLASIAAWNRRADPVRDVLAKLEADMLAAIGSGDTGIRDAALLAAYDAIRALAHDGKTERPEASAEGAKAPVAST